MLSTSLVLAMNKPISLALLVIGIILLVMGFNASESVSSEVSEAVTGTPTDKSIWLLIGGALLAIVGGFGMVRRRA
jgi:LPXTG-motif cell wall-anchored protein